MTQIPQELRDLLLSLNTVGHHLSGDNCAAISGRGSSCFYSQGVQSSLELLHSFQWNIPISPISTDNWKSNPVCDLLEVWSTVNLYHPILHHCPTPLSIPGQPRHQFSSFHFPHMAIKRNQSLQESKMIWLPCHAVKVPPGLKRQRSACRIGSALPN